jgi:hypothetical protein
MNMFSAQRSFRNRRLSEFAIELSKPRNWLGGWYLGEYVGVAEKPVAQANS